MRKSMIVLALVSLATAEVPAARAQNFEPADLRVASAALGYGAARITGLGTTPDRVMSGFEVRMDLHILSLLLHNLPVATYDAAFIDLTYGKMSSTPLNYLAVPEGTSNLVFSAGYTFLAGIRRGGLAVLGGLTYHKFNHGIGDSNMDGSKTPVTARVELGGRRKIVAMGYVGSGMMGGRLDVPFFRRLNLTAAYWQADGTAEPWNMPAGSSVPARAKMLLLGFRTAEVR